MSHWRLKLARRRAAARCRGEGLAELLRSPLPPPSTPFAEAEFVSLDIETTGLDARTARMLSVGWVAIRGARIVMDSAESWIVRAAGEVGDSATVHGLTDSVVESGAPLDAVLERIALALRGQVLVVHFAGLDKVLLDRLCRETFGAPLLVPVVDTLALEHRLHSRRHHLEDRSSLRLSALREAYGLPRYGQHDCLADAIATGELLLAMAAGRGERSGIRLGDLLT